MPDYYEDDRRGRHRGSYSYNLNVNDHVGRSGRSRSRSRSSPNRMPDINIYNDVYADNDVRAQQTPDNRRPPYASHIPVMLPQQMPMAMAMPGGYPAMMYPPPQPQPQPQPQSPQQQPSLRPTHTRSSSSRSRSQHRHNSDTFELEKMKADKEREAAIAEYKRQMDREEEDRQHAIKHAELEREEQEKERKAAAEQAILDYKNKEKKRKDEEQRIAEEYERKKKERDEEEKAAAEEYMRKKKEKEKKEEEEQKEATRKTLAKAGMTEAQIDHILNPPKERGRSISNTQVVLRPAVNPIYPKIARRDIAPETLKHYKLQWVYDETDPDYLIIMHEMTVRETDILFKHTAKVRERGKGGYMIEADRNDFVMVRKRSKSRGKSPARPEKVVGKLFLR